MMMIHFPINEPHIQCFPTCSTISDKATTLVMDRLLSAVVGTNNNNNNSHQEDDDVNRWTFQMKAGEALVQSLQRCGQSMPVYAPKVIPVLIQGAQPQADIRPLEEEEGEDDVEQRKEKAHFRASCLSGLADVCELLGWSLRRYLNDIIDLSMGIIKLEQGHDQPSVLVRRAALFLMQRMLVGTGPERILAVLGKKMTDIEQALKMTSSRDK